MAKKKAAKPAESVRQDMLHVTLPPGTRALLEEKLGKNVSRHVRELLAREYELPELLAVRRPGNPWTEKNAET